MITQGQIYFFGQGNLLALMRIIWIKLQYTFAEEIAQKVIIIESLESLIASFFAGKFLRIA